MSYYLDKNGVLCAVEQVSADRALIYAKPGETFDVGQALYIIRREGQLPEISLTLDDYTEEAA
jgi:phage gp46-like protein